MFRIDINPFYYEIRERLEIPDIQIIMIYVVKFY